MKPNGGVNEIVCFFSMLNGVVPRNTFRPCCVILLRHRDEKFFFAKCSQTSRALYYLGEEHAYYWH